MTNLIEKWRPLTNNPTYSISNTGIIKNSHTARILKVDIAYKKGRIIASKLRIRVNGKQRNFAVHKLVMHHFGPPKPDIPDITIDHINRNPLDNKINNLRWATRKEQCSNKIKRPRRKVTMDELDIIFYRAKTETLDEISNDIGIDRGAIWALLIHMHPDY